MVYVSLKGGGTDPQHSRRDRGAFPIKFIKEYRESSVKPPNNILLGNPYVAKSKMDDVCAAHPKETVCLHQDRKSTRLNSSHSQISYAVFCLKKKTS